MSADNRFSPALHAFFEKLSVLFPQLDIASLADRYTDISHRYRSAGVDVALKSEQEVLAYCFARLPATFTVLEKTLSELIDLTATHIHSITDLGCGPGASYFAFQHLFPHLQNTTCVDGNAAMMHLTQKVLQDEKNVSLIKTPMQHYTFLPTDLTLFSYSLGELTHSVRRHVLLQAWEQTKHALIVIEPGTPEGFAVQSAAREVLIESGAFIVAPCGHNAPCPLLTTPDDWCHFATHVPRSQAHKQLKKGALSYELEKYTYLIATQQPVAVPRHRIIRPPLKRSGHLILDICTQAGIVRTTYTKAKNKEYKKVQKAHWGDLV